MKNKIEDESSDTNLIDIIFYGAGVATPDPGEAPTMAGFFMKSPAVHNGIW